VKLSVSKLVIDMESGNDLLKTALEAAYSISRCYVDNLDRTPVGATASLEQLRRQLAKPLGDEGLPPGQVIAELSNDVEGGLHTCAGGRFFGWVRGGAVPASLGADWLTSVWDQNAALYSVGPSAAVVEEVAGAWLKELLGLPASASFAFVTGTQMAHLTCLAAARHELLARRGWDVEQLGLYGAPRIRILASNQRHGTVERAVRLLGLGRDHITDLSTDSTGQVIPEALESELRFDPSGPALIILQAGDINTGAFDRFTDVIPIARRFDAWVHIDGAFGLWAGASPRFRHLMNGADSADSWVTDGHKWLNVPFDSGYAFVAAAGAHRASLSLRAAYLTHSSDARDEMEWNPEWSRRARGFATYAALRELGRCGVANLVERCCGHAYALVTRIGSQPGAELLCEPIINQGLVRFLDPHTGASESDHDRYTDRVIAAIAATGEAFFTGTAWHGKRAMRVSVCNWQTSDQDVERVLRAVSAVLTQLNMKD
jgi:glutamate/tyrosine decarboxylase-like PLP-dependent enzyme